MVNQLTTPIEYITAHDAASLLKCSLSAIHVYQHRGKLKKVGKATKEIMWGSIRRKMSVNLYNRADVLRLAK